jgi:DNA (cytosine-5)-methyltransferase 1
MPVPIIDLFAGPGGLGEGFSALRCGGKPVFKIALSIEKDANAHKTLLTRAFYREFSPQEVPEAYYEHLRGEITQPEMFERDDRCKAAANRAKNEAFCIELGEPADKTMSTEEKKKQRLRTQQKVRDLISDRISGHSHWVLIGGPPCQAYSLAGRSRMTGVVQKKGETSEQYEKRRRDVVAAFEGDHRQLLYREYLSIIADHWPSIFVMENVRGLLSARLNRQLVFPMIRKDLEDPNQAIGKKQKGGKYRIYSLVVPELVPGAGFNSEDFLIRAEQYGVPQQRHRVILLGIRDNLNINSIPVLKKQRAVVVEDALQGLPPLHPGVTKPSRPLTPILAEIRGSSWLAQLGRGSFSGKDFQKLKTEIIKALEKAESKELSQGASFLPNGLGNAVPGKLGSWLTDRRLGGMCNHETKAHMAGDLHRYIFVSAFGKVFGRSPTLSDFPKNLLPNHENVKGEDQDLQKFADRFRVQLADGPAKTITCHISKDGHANIHPDPAQLRALTVREAARIQTFPDNYFFEGEKTAQYQQVGNAVPPYLAHQIASVVSRLLAID